MGNSESHYACREAEEKLKECVRDHYRPKLDEICTRLSIEGYKATYHDEDNTLVYDNLARGACKVSVTAFREGPDIDKHATMRECMEANSDYYHKYLSMCERIEKQIKEEIESTYPFIYMDGREIAYHKARKEGDCCKEEYADYKGCCLRPRRSS